MCQSLTYDTWPRGARDHLGFFFQGQLRCECIGSRKRILPAASTGGISYERLLTESHIDHVCKLEQLLHITRSGKMKRASNNNLKILT